MEDPKPDVDVTIEVNEAEKPEPKTVETTKTVSQGGWPGIPMSETVKTVEKKVTDA